MRIQGYIIHLKGMVRCLNKGLYDEHDLEEGVIILVFQHLFMLFLILHSVHKCISSNSRALEITNSNTSTSPC